MTVTDTIIKLSLSAVWLMTGVFSLTLGKDIGYAVLAKGNIVGVFADVAIIFGSLLDMLMGLWVLLNWRVKLCCQAQTAVILTYTLLLTIIDFSFWYHPFGPLTKNLPMLVLIQLLASRHSK